jgi:hypothetical protein
MAFGQVKFNNSENSGAEEVPVHVKNVVQRCFGPIIAKVRGEDCCETKNYREVATSGTQRGQTLE